MNFLLKRWALLSGLMVAMAFGVSSVSAQSYVSHWSAEENVWDTVGNNDNGFWTSDGRAGYVPVESYVPGKVGQAFNINWPTWIEVPQTDNLTLSGNTTISLWFRTDRNKNGALLSINDSWQVFLLGDNNACGFNNPREPSYGNYLKCVGSVVFRAEGTNGSAAVVNSGIHANKNHYLDGQWHHFVGVFDAQTSRLSVYVDGEFVATSSQTIPGIQPSDSPILIGARYPNPLPFIGDIDEVSILSEALNAAEVADLHAGVLLPSEPATEYENAQPATAIASSNYPVPTAASLAIDGDVNTSWNSGNWGPSWIEVTFDQPRTFSGLHVTGVAVPAVTEAYTITATKADGNTVVVSDDFTIPLAPAVGIKDFDLGLGFTSYTKVRIEAKNSAPYPDASWIAIAEIQLIVLESTPTPTPTPTTVPGLVHLWSGNGDATDAVSNSDGFTGMSTAFGAGLNGQAFSFDGAQSSLVKFPVDINPSALPNMTVGMFVKLDKIANPYGWVFTNDNGGFDRSVILHDNRFGAGFAAGVGGTYTSTLPKIDPGQWHCVAVSYSEDTRQTTVFINGEAQVVRTQRFASGLRDVFLGGHPIAPGHTVSGLIDEVFLFDRALSVAEIEQVCLDLGGPLNGPPVADAGTYAPVEAISPSGTPVTLDGSASSDPDNDALTYAWSATDIDFDDANNATPTGDFPVGETTVTLTVDDGNGETATDEVVVTITDGTAPTLTIPGDIAAECTGPNGESIDLGTASAKDNGDANPVITNDAPDTYPMGTTMVKWTAIDASGNATSAEQTVLVQDTTSPELTVPGDITAEATSPDGASVDLGEASASDICDPDPAITSDGTLSVYPLGSTTVTWTATDASNNATPGGQVVNVVDTTPPDVNFSLNTGTLWPPNHKMVQVASGISANDIADEDPSVVITVTSDEDINGSGDGNTEVDWEVNNGTVYLRAERDGGQDGRVYTVTVVATDAAGNTTTVTGTVDVPHGQNVASADAGNGKGKGKAKKLVVVSQSVTPVLVVGEAKVIAGQSSGVALSQGESVTIVGAGPVVADQLLDISGEADVASRMQEIVVQNHTFSLSQNHPNPFNPETVIGYALGEASDVSLIIYNVLGQQVRELVNASQAPGQYTARWDGRNALGVQVTSGVYIYRLVAGTQVEMRKMILLK